MFSKKGIMLKFLTTLILALIIFVPACMFVSNFFRVSEQAKQNFNSFTTEIKQLENPNVDVNIHQITILILDEQTAIVYFPVDSKEVKLTVKPTSNSAKGQELFFKRESSCSKDKGCLCLIQEFKKSEGAGRYSNVFLEDSKLYFISKSVNCVDFDSRLSLVNCGIGEAVGVEGYNCEGGFVIERGVVKEFTNSFYYNLGRRVSFQLSKGGDSINLEAK